MAANLDMEEGSDAAQSKSVHASVSTPITKVFNSLEEVAACLHGDREAANEKLGHLLEHGPKSDAEKLLIKQLKGEIFHVKFVRKAFGHLSGKESNHDWSKDYVFMATIGMAFTLKRKDLVEDCLDNEAEKHFELEDHHTEHIDYTKTLMTDGQILEMAVDRLSRNLHFNKGSVNLEEMLNFEPKIRKCPACGQKGSSGDLQFYDYNYTFIMSPKEPYVMNPEETLNAGCIAASSHRIRCIDTCCSVGYYNVMVTTI